MTREQDDLREIARHAQAQVDYMAHRATGREVATDTLVALVARAIDKEAMDGPASPWNIGRVMALDKAIASIAAIEAGGYAIVPAKPTDEMRAQARSWFASHEREGWATIKRKDGHTMPPSEIGDAVFASMLAARPKVQP